jgi:cytochrome b6-f complex iron-sulfur subunit
MEEPSGSGADIRGPVVSRRRFLSYLLSFSILATLGGVLAPIISYLWPSYSHASGGRRDPVQIGTIADFPVGKGKVVPVSQGGIRAFSAICTHLGCIVEWDQSRHLIVCPCHDAHFNAVNGAVVSGPPPSPLTQLKVSQKDDAIYVSES